MAKTDDFITETAPAAVQQLERVVLQLKASMESMGAAPDNSGIEDQITDITASISSINTTLAAKADQADMTTALAGKASTTSVTAKADKTALDALALRVAALETAVADLEAAAPAA